MSKVVVLDHGSGNVRSAVRALERAGASVELTADRAAAEAADGLVVPGVGAFASCMAGLRAVEGPRTIGRRLEADISLPWDRQVSRVHAELRRLAGEWTIVDDGLSQNGTYVNEVRLMGRRRLHDGDDVRLGRTHLAYRDPSAHASALTLLPGELTAATAFSDQQHRILRELCRPYASSEEARVRPASDRAIAAALRLPVHVVQSEMEALTEAFGLADLPEGTARKEVARSALLAGIVSLEDLG